MSVQYRQIKQVYFSVLPKKNGNRAFLMGSPALYVYIYEGLEARERNQHDPI